MERTDWLLLLDSKSYSVGVSQLLCITKLRYDGRSGSVSGRTSFLLLKNTLAWNGSTPDEKL